MKKYTYGDDQELACPHCGEFQMFMDWVNEGWSGGETECDDCRKSFIVDVDHSVDLTGHAEIDE